MQFVHLLYMILTLIFINLYPQWRGYGWNYCNSAHFLFMIELHDPVAMVCFVQAESHNFTTHILNSLGLNNNSIHTRETIAFFSFKSVQEWRLGASHVATKLCTFLPDSQLLQHLLVCSKMSYSQFILRSLKNVVMALHH